MKAITVEPKKPGKVRYMDIPELNLNDGSVLVEAGYRKGGYGKGY